MLNDLACGVGPRRTSRHFEVTVLTTRSGATAVVVPACDREAARATVADQLSSGDFIAPPEHCTDDVQTEIWTIRELT
jgi:hypothetical protein